MKHDHRHAAVVGLWILATSAAGLAMQISSVSNWAALAGIGLIPSVVLMRLWRTPSPSMSESIQEALR